MAPHSSGLWLPASDERSVERDLQRLDDRLFLSWEIERDRDGEPIRVYRVMCEYAGDHFAPVCDWRDEKQRPLPLSSGLVELVRSLRPRGGTSVQEAIDANAAHQAQVEADFERDVDELIADMAPRISDKRSAVLPRGAHLARSRRKQRRLGENV